MKTERTIVVGHDLEEDGGVALVHAMRFADALGAATVHVVHVVEPVPRNVGSSARRMDDAMDLLRAILATVSSESPVTARAHVRLGDPAGQLMQTAVDYDADLLVVGTHARRGLQRLRYGSVAETLVRSARLPVLVARAKDFEGMAATPRPDTALEGATVEGDQLVSDVIVVGPRRAHIAGLI